jgi:hypothetical protein
MARRPPLSARPRLLATLRYLRRLVVGAVFLYAAVALTLGGTRAAPPTFRLLLLGWAILLAVRWRRSESDISVSLSRLELVATNIAFTLLLAELALRAWAACSGQTLLWSTALDGHRLRPGHDYGGGLVGNRLGYPGPDISTDKPVGTHRVIALGDSFAVGVVPFERNYLTLLQKALPGVEVCNFGLAGAGPREYHAALQRDGWALRPDLVLVSVFVGNDVTETLPEPRHLDPRGSALYLLGERAWKVLREYNRRPAEARATTPLGAGGLSQVTFREVEARRLRVCLSPPPAPVEKQWRRAVGHLGRLVEECRTRGAPVAAVLIPDEFQVNPTVLEQALRDSGVERSAIDLDLPQRRLGAFFAQRGVPCLDLRPALTADSYAPRDTHWNERGNRLAAEAVARWLPPILDSRTFTLSHR